MVTTPQTLSLAPSLSLTAAGQTPQQQQQAALAQPLDDILLFDDDVAGGTALGVATVDVASDAADDVVRVATADVGVGDADVDDDSDAPLLSPALLSPARAAPPAPTRCVTQYIRFPVRGMQPGDSKREEVLGVVAMDVSLGTPVILGVVPGLPGLHGDNKKTLTLTHMNKMGKKVHVAKAVSLAPTTTAAGGAPALTLTATPALTPTTTTKSAAPLLITKPSNKPTTRSATGALSVPAEDKAGRGNAANTNPIGTGRRISALLYALVVRDAFLFWSLP